MENQTLILPVNDFLNAPQGKNETFALDSEIDLQLKGTQEKSPVTGRITVMRIEKGLNVSCDQLKITLEMHCSKCNKVFEKEVDFTEVERLFLFKEDPQNYLDPHEVFYVDMKRQEIDVYEMIRQEIILHFPLISVCSNSCKGLCASCGVNLNNKSCSCPPPETPQRSTQLSALKDLVKENKK